MARIGHFSKRACTDRSAGEHASHYWGYVVIDDRLTPVRLTQKQAERAHAVALNNMDDCPPAPGKLEEIWDQLMTGKDIVR